MNINQLIKSSKCDPLTPDREKELGEQLKIAIEENDKKAIKEIREELIMRHMRLILFIGKGYSHVLDKDDIISVGSLALTHCVNNWDPDKGHLYSWAERWITTGLTRAADANRTIRIPQGVAYKAGLIQKEINKKANQLNRDLTRIEKNEIIGDVTSFDDLPLVNDSLDRKMLYGDQKETKTLGDTIELENSNPADIIEKLDVISQIKMAISELTNIEQTVIKCRFGIDEEHKMTLAQLGDKFGVTGEAMRRIEATALAKLRHPSLKNDIDGL
jgi:RNA polymerase sigma factor (sigma-70 family)